jgi:hypothetical protein
MQPGSPSMPEPGRSCRKGGGHHTVPAWGGRRSGYGARSLGDGGRASSSSGQSGLFGGRSVRARERGPTFLRIQWWEGLQEADGLPVLRGGHVVQAPPHGNRPQVPDAQGCGQMGTRCDFCESRRPRGA